MVVFLSIWKVMVLGLAGSCPKFCLSLEVCDCPTVRVKEVFSTEAILPDTDCSCGALELLDRLRSAASWVVGGGKAQTATTRVRLATVVKNTRPTFFIFGPPRIFGRACLFCSKFATTMGWREKSYILCRILGLRGVLATKTF